MLRTTLFVTIFLGSGAVHAQGWMRNYTGANIVPAASAPLLDGSGVFVAGNYTSPTGTNQLYLAKMRADGTLAFSRTFACATGTHLQAPVVAALPDGGALFAGGGQNGCGPAPADVFTHIIVLRLDAAGNIVWQRRLRTATHDFPESLAPTVDGGFLLAGWSGTSNISAYVTKLTSMGNPVWSRRYGKGTYDRLHSIIEIQEATGKYGLAVGTTNSRDSSNQDFWILKLTSDTGANAGSVSYDIVTTGISGNDELTSVSQVVSGQPGYAAAGTTVWVGNTDGIVIKIDPVTANPMFADRLWGSTSAHDVLRWIRVNPADNGFIVAGETDGFSGVNHDGWLIKLNAVGTPMWGKTYGGTMYNDRLFAVEPIAGGFFAGGTAPSFTGATPSMLAVRTNSLGEVTPSCPDVHPGMPLMASSSPSPFFINDNGDSGFAIDNATVVGASLTVTPSNQCI
jgi:hypothetical protein